MPIRVAVRGLRCRFRDRKWPSRLGKKDRLGITFAILMDESVVTYKASICLRIGGRAEAIGRSEKI
jgi:hypothetical protein